VQADVASVRDEDVLTIDADGGATEFQRLDSFEEANPDAIENEYSKSDHATAYESRELDGGFEGDAGFVRRDGERDAKMDAMASAPARGEPLHEQLQMQWSLVEVDPALKPLGRAIIASLDDDGYLRTPLEQVAREFVARVGEIAGDDEAVAGKAAESQAAESQAAESGAPPSAEVPARVDPHVMERFERGLQAVQLFLEPAGVAARTPGECLLLQLDALMEDGQDIGWPSETFEHARRLVRDHIDDLMQNRLPKVAEKSGLTLDQIRDALSLLKRLSLAPARRLAPDDNAPVTPDAIIEYDADEDRYVAYLNESRIPNLRVNQEYARLTRDRGMEKRDRDFIRTNMSNAQWLIDAIGQRKRTLLRVAQAVATAQREFFDYGPQALKPLPMTLVADELGIHVATVSRAVADKYVRTPRGVLALRRFFSGGVQTKGETGDDSGEMAWDAIKAALQEVVSAEDKRSPLSDEALVDELKKRGITIARRTIAKYRDQLGIPTARMRKQY
jgi:RNA polymerase sigma-54 factor